MRRVHKAVRYAGIYARYAGRSLAYRSVNNKDILVVPPAGAGSLGDQAMLQAITDHLHLMQAVAIRQVLMPEWASFPLHGVESPRLRFSLNEVLEKSPKLISAIRNAKAVVAVGADVIDGRYGMKAVKYELGILQVAAELGVPTALLGHSISESPDPEAVALLAALPASTAIFVRDPISLQRFESFTGRAGTLVSDLAFLVQPDTNSRNYADAQQWATRQKRLGNKILCLNVNGLNAQSGLTHWRDFLEHLWQGNPNIGVLFLSHDTRPTSSDSLAHQQIVASLPAEKLERVFLAADPESAASAKALAALADVVLTGRMHLAIGALSLSVPTFCLAYAGKFEGLARHLDINDFFVPSDIVDNADEMAEWLLAKLPTLETRRAALDAILPSVKALALKNFAFPL